MSRELVLELLTYIEQVEKLKIKPAFSIPDRPFVAFQDELSGLPELQFNLQVDGDDIWLRLPRLREIAAPDPEQPLAPWIILPKSPEKSPELKDEIVAQQGAGESTHKRIEDHSEIRELFTWYVENQWNPWASAEGPRRKAIAKYNQLFSLQQAIASEGGETPLELVWGIGYAVWKKAGFATPVKYPLLVQACEVTLNEKNFDLEVRPRNVEPSLEADCYAALDVSGVKQLEDFWRTAQSTSANRVNPFEPSTYDGVLKAAVGYLDSTGSYEVRDANAALPVPDDKLKITNTWVLFARTRSGDIFLQDIDRLKKKVAEVDTIPSVVRSFVEPGDVTVRVRPEQAFRGLSSSESTAGALELYFPMPYNDEQVSIVQKLYANDGVVVQGPPGTGKTHTIANVICHYLALGKRVLVTAKTESALAVLQDKLPDAVRPLSVSLLSNERDGMKQFEHSIQTIASKVAGINPTRMAADIAAAEEELNQLHAKIAYVDTTIADRAAKHMRSYSFRGRDVTPEEMAKLALEYAETHQWFDDAPPMHDGAVPFDDAAVSALRQARMTVGQDICYLKCRLPDPEGFPSWLDILNLHRDLAKAKAIDAGVIRGNTLPLVDSRTETLENAQRLLTFLDGRAALKERVSNARQPWLRELSGRFAKMQPGDPRLQALMGAIHEIHRLEQQRRDLVAKGVEVPVDAELNNDFKDAVARLVSGKGAFAFPFGKRDARALIAGVAVSGAAPAHLGDWELVQAVVTWRGDAKKVIARWNLLSSEFELEQPEEALAAGFKQMVVWATTVDENYRLTFDYDAKLHSRLETVFGKTIADQACDGDEQLMRKVHASLVSHVDKGRLSCALDRQQELIRKLDGCQGGIVDEFRNFLTGSVCQVEADESALEKAWATLQIELRQLIALRPCLDEISRVTAEIDKAGAKKWAKRLRTEPASTDLDPVTPTNWLDAWNWRQAVMLLDNLDGHKQLRELFDERRTLTTALARTYQGLVAEKTWLGVFSNSPDSVRRALQAYLVAVRSIGKGTGVRAVMYRRDARKAMERAYPAVPCWILPHWRVSESIPADIGVFDLVVIDEASQSDITCLPAVLRGTKVLVVGDDKQVSPSAVGLATTVIQDLRDRFLRLFPEGALMTPERSFYDLAQAVFAGNSVMLKEHFRCVPAIIEFSNREFYHGDIRPLRVPKANERLDPPLVDVFVKGGFRKGDVNPVEAKAVVDEIKSILQDQRLAGRSIGVVTLLGTEQAAHIHDLVSRQISPVDVVARKITVGPPPVFQGGERDIMLVSMVVGPGDRSAASRADMFQRFNVALSRARDRMYLFRSVTDAQFNDGSLNGKVIGHFRQPFRQNVTAVQALRERCESGFEQEMFDELVRRGFRVEPQVRCGGYRIDFVVEGNEGRRLAIECDGDRFHGPGQWKDDMVRQRVLERAGWTFWRCFASTFVRDREAVLDDLTQTLSKLGIEPLGAESLDTTMWVSHKEVDPYGVDVAEGEQNVGQEEELA